MKKKLINNFFKDHLLFNVILFLNTLFIFLFYYSTLNQEVELIYPLVISFFGAIVYNIIQWYKQYEFNRELKNCKDNSNYKLTTKTQQQKHIFSVIEQIHSKYNEKIRNLKRENDINNKFLTQWIHNLKTPVTVQNLILQQVHNSMFNEEDLTSLKHENKVILDNLQIVLNLIRVNEFSKDYVPSSINLPQSINKVIKKNKNLFIYNKVFPKVEISDKDIWVLSDEKWNEFIIEQNVINAVKYSAVENKSKYITFKVERDNEKYTTLKIIDEGIGIPTYDMDRICEPFFTGENGRYYKNSTGIGLYICSVVAEKLNHNLNIESELGEGTTVSLRYLSKI